MIRLALIAVMMLGFAIECGEIVLHHHGSALESVGAFVGGLIVITYLVSILES